MLQNKVGGPALITVNHGSYELVRRKALEAFSCLKAIFGLVYVTKDATGLDNAGSTLGQRFLLQKHPVLT